MKRLLEVCVICACLANVSFGAKLRVTTKSLPSGQVGVAYAQTLAATGGKGDYSWSTTAGSLPDGLSLAPAGGISGVPTTVGPNNFRVQVTDSANATATQALSIAVDPPPLSITTTSLPGGTVGAAYSQTLAASGGAGGNSWTTTAGALPAGLTLASNGTISGTPTAAGTANFTLIFYSLRRKVAATY
jgi:hypothetical protein